MPEHLTFAQAAASAAYIRSHTQHTPAIGLILGSGLNALAERVAEPDVIPYETIPHFPRSTVPGHSGRLVIGALGGARVLVMQGRVHFYEGYSAEQVVYPIRVMQALGLHTVIVTNAAGGLNPAFRAGDLMAITDHINLLGLAGHTPLRGQNDDRLGPRFPSMAPAYDPVLLALLRAEAQARNIPLQEGVYLMVAGPSFETPAEVRMARALGADAVGMSTAAEVVAARHAGLRVLGISMISNMAVAEAPAQAAADVHAEVLAAGAQAAPRLAALLEGVLRRLA